MGLINIKDFLVAQHVIWFKRADISTRDNWRVDLHECGYGNVFTTNPKEISPRTHPILHSLAESFSSFSKIFTSLDNNYLEAFILNNPIFLRNGNSELYLDNAFFQDSGSGNIYLMARMKFKDFFQNGVFKSLHDLNSNSLLNLNFTTYFRLRAALLFFLSTINHDSTLPSTSLNSLLSSFKKGSKSCRRILGKSNAHTFAPSVSTFFSLVGLPLPEKVLLHATLPLWCRTSIPNRFREFLFKFFLIS